jgi:hypothetical protein
LDTALDEAGSDAVGEDEGEDEGANDQAGPDQVAEASDGPASQGSAGGSGSGQPGGEAAPGRSVEFRLQPESGGLARLEPVMADGRQPWPANPFTAHPAPILDTADEVDASWIVRPLFALGTAMPTFRRRTPSSAETGGGGGAGLRTILLGLGGLLVALAAVAGALLVPDLVTDSERSEFDQLLDGARQGLTAATLATDPVATRLELALALSAAEEALALRPLNAEAALLEQEIDVALGQANAIMRPPDLVTLLDFGSGAALGLVEVADDTAFLLEEASGRVLAFDFAAGETSVIFESGQEYLFIGDFAGVAATRPIGIEWTATALSASLTILDDSGQLFRYTEAGGAEAYRLPNGEVVSSADGLTADAGALYLLDGRGGLVWRFPFLADGGLDAGSGAISRTELGEATDLAIAADGAGGTVFVSSSDGRIRRFVDGRDQGFPLDLDRPLLVPGSLVLAETSGLLYIVDRGNSRILAVTLAGEIVAQLRDDLLIGVRGVHVDDLNERIYYVTATAMLVSAMPEVLRR